MNIIEIDGSRGEGGGQVLRTALSVAIIRGQRLHMVRIREGRDKPGLLRQHLTCVNAAQTICNAVVEGAELGSQELTFSPGKIVSGDYRFDIGSAGSTSLVLQTIFLPLALQEIESQVVIIGGTHNRQAPPFEFLAQSWVPIIRTLGFNIELTLSRHGFYPAGGGQVEAKISPLGKIQKPHDLLTKSPAAVSAYVWSAHLPERIGREELAIIARELSLASDVQHYRSVESSGPGNVIEIILRTPALDTVITAFGAPGLPLQKVADDAIAQTKRMQSSKAVVDSHLADQLLLPVALAGGGRFSTVTPSEHTRTNAGIIRETLGATIEMTEIGPDHWHIEVNKESKNARI